MSTTVLCFHYHRYKASFFNKISLKSCNNDIRWDLNFTNHIHFQPLEVVCRGSETQLQVTEQLNSSVI